MPKLFSYGRPSTLTTANNKNTIFSCIQSMRLPAYFRLTTRLTPDSMAPIFRSRLWISRSYFKRTISPVQFQKAIRASCRVTMRLLLTETPPPLLHPVVLRRVRKLSAPYPKASAKISHSRVAERLAFVPGGGSVLCGSGARSVAEPSPTSYPSTRFRRDWRVCFCPPLRRPGLDPSPSSCCLLAVLRCDRAQYLPACQSYRSRVSTHQDSTSQSPRNSTSHSSMGGR